MLAACQREVFDLQGKITVMDCNVIMAGANISQGISVASPALSDSQRVSEGDVRGRSRPRRPGTPLHNTIFEGQEPQDGPSQTHAGPSTADERMSTSRHVMTSAGEGVSIEQPPEGRVPLVPPHFGKGVMIYVGKHSHLPISHQA